MLNNVNKSFLKSYLKFSWAHQFDKMFLDYWYKLGQTLNTRFFLLNCKGAQIQIRFQPTVKRLGVDSLHEYIFHTRHTKTIVFVIFT